MVDRFYVKRCNKCEEFGHYEKDCTNRARCGYSMGPHLSLECTEVDEGDHEHFKCGNCKDAVADLQRLSTQKRKKLNAERKKQERKKLNARS